MIKCHCGLFVHMKATANLTCILLAPVWFLILTTWADGWHSARLAAFSMHTNIKPPPGFKGGGRGNDGGGTDSASYCQPHAWIYVTHIPVMLQSQWILCHLCWSPLWITLWSNSAVFKRKSCGKSCKESGYGDPVITKAAKKQMRW